MKTHLTLVPASTNDFARVDAIRWLDGRARAVMSGSFGPGWFDADDRHRAYYDTGEALGAPCAAPFVVRHVEAGLAFSPIPKNANQFELALMELDGHELWRVAVRGAMALEAACAYIVAQARIPHDAEAEPAYQAALRDMLRASASAGGAAWKSAGGSALRQEWTTRADGAPDQGARYGIF